MNTGSSGMVLCQSRHTCHTFMNFVVVSVFPWLWLDQLVPIKVMLSTLFMNAGLVFFCAALPVDG